MGRTVLRSYIINLLNQLYINQENNCYFCMNSCFIFCITAESLEKQLRNKKFGTENSKVENWFIINLKENTNNIMIFSI